MTLKLGTGQTIFKLGEIKSLFFMNLRLNHQNTIISGGITLPQAIKKSFNKWELSRKINLEGEVHLYIVKK